MKIYEVDADFDNFDVCKIDYEACKKLRDIPDYDMMFNFDGSSQTKNWWPRVMERHNDKSKLGGYISKLGGDVMILEREAIDKLKSLMGNIEVLPLKCDFGDYWAINVLDVLECVDYKKSEFVLLSDELEDGRPRIMYFSKYQFIKEKIEGHNVFKIIDTPKSAIFVNETFVNEVVKHGITGFKFELVWQDQVLETGAFSTQNALIPKTKSKRVFSKKAPKAFVTPLEEDVMRELCQMEKEAYELIGSNENNSPSEIANLIYSHVDKLLLAEKSEEEISSISILLAVAWGFAVCSEYNWEWRYLEIEGKIERSYYILSPDHWYCCPPFYFFTKILDGKNIGLDGKNDNTALLLFNMIKTLGKKTPKEKYTVIS